MRQKTFPVIDPAATGANIVRLRRARGLSVRDLQAYFGFEEPQAIYKWQKGKSLPSVDNLYALGALLEVPMEEILVSTDSKWNELVCEQQADACCSPHFWGVICPAAADTAGARGSRRPFSAPRPGCPPEGVPGPRCVICPEGLRLSSAHPSRMGRGWRCECGRAGGGAVSQRRVPPRGALRKPVRAFSGVRDRNSCISAESAQSSNVQRYGSSAPEPAWAEPRPCRIRGRWTRGRRAVSPPPR